MREHPWTLLRIAGKCCQIQPDENFIKGTGIVIDFKDLKTIVQESIITKLDHRLMLSRNFITENKMEIRNEMQILKYEPTAEKLLIFIRKELTTSLPAGIRLVSLKLWETPDSYAVWSPA